MYVCMVFASRMNSLYPSKMKPDDADAKAEYDAKVKEASKQKGSSLAVSICVLRL